MLDILSNLILGESLCSAGHRIAAYAAILVYSDSSCFTERLFLLCRYDFDTPSLPKFRLTLSRQLSAGEPDLLQALLEPWFVIQCFVCLLRKEAQKHFASNHNMSRRQALRLATRLLHAQQSASRLCPAHVHAAPSTAASPAHQVDALLQKALSVVLY